MRKGEGGPPWGSEWPQALTPLEASIPSAAQVRGCSAAGESTGLGKCAWWGAETEITDERMSRMAGRWEAGLGTAGPGSHVGIANWGRTSTRAAPGPVPGPSAAPPAGERRNARSGLKPDVPCSCVRYHSSCQYCTFAITADMTDVGHPPPPPRCTPPAGNPPCPPPSL